MSVAHKVTLENLLQRVNLPIEFDELGVLVSMEFNLGKVISYKPMLVGYEELNSQLETSKGTFVVKVFSKDKTKESIEGNIHALSNFYTNGIPVPRLYTDSKGSTLYQISDSNTSLCVMDYFKGKKFTEFTPQMDDLLSLAGYLAKINNMNFKIEANYDSWITINLESEFNSKNEYLNSNELSLIEPVVKDLSKVDMNKLSRGIVHFDLHRENALKSKNGDYCILDLASVDYNYTIFDLATFIALFCFDPTQDDKAIVEKTYKAVVEKYNLIRKISEYELLVLPTLIKCAYASNLLIPVHLQKTGTDENPEQTSYYKSLGLSGLKMMQNFMLQ